MDVEDDMSSRGLGEMPMRDMNAEPEETATPSAGHGEMPVKAMNEESTAGETHATESDEQAQAIDYELAVYLQERQSRAQAEHAGKHGEMPVKGME